MTNSMMVFSDQNMVSVIATVDPLSLWDFNYNESYLNINFYNNSPHHPSPDDVFIGANFNHSKNAIFTGKLSNRNNTNNRSVATTRAAGSGGDVFQNNVIVPLYLVIFLLSVVGNSLVILTLAQNKRMRTVTNVYLLNLVSSLKKS
jgi:hypothetical protein